MKTWNLKAPLYSLFRKPWPLCIIHKRETENIISLLHLIPQQDGTGLDLGCGVGHSMKLSEDSMPLIGLDSSFIMARQASKTTNRPVVVADALSHPFKSKSLCLIMAVGLIEYLEDSEKFFQPAPGLSNREAFCWSPARRRDFSRRCENQGETKYGFGTRKRLSNRRNGSRLKS